MRTHVNTARSEKHFPDSSITLTLAAKRQTQGPILMLKSSQFESVAFPMITAERKELVPFHERSFFLPLPLIASSVVDYVYGFKDILGEKLDLWFQIPLPHWTLQYQRIMLPLISTDSPIATKNF